MLAATAAVTRRAMAPRTVSTADWIAEPRRFAAMGSAIWVWKTSAHALTTVAHRQVLKAGSVAMGLTTTAAVAPTARIRTAAQILSVTLFVNRLARAVT